MRKNTLILFFICFCSTLFAQTQLSNIAYQDETVRFTVISDGTMRLEYSPNGQFVDKQSFIAVIIS